MQWCFLPSCLICQNPSHRYPPGLLLNYHVLNPPSKKTAACWIFLQSSPSLSVYFYPNEVHFTVVQYELPFSSCVSFNCHYSLISIISWFSSRLLMKNIKWNRTQTLQQWKKNPAKNPVLPIQCCIHLISIEIDWMQAVLPRSYFLSSKYRTQQNNSKLILTCGFAKVIHQLISLKSTWIHCEGEQQEACNSRHRPTGKHHFRPSTIPYLDSNLAP